MRQLLLATTSEGKLREMRVCFSDLPFKLCSLVDLPQWPVDFDIAEPAKTFEGNSIIKAMTAGKRTGLLTLAEDAGLEVDALQGAPGVYSKRFAPGTDEDRNQKLLQMMKDVPQALRTAKFRAVMTVYDPTEDRVYLCEGESTGHITVVPHGAHGFGYDPVFFCDALGKTNAEATIEEKNTISHRGYALQKVKQVLLDNFV